ncbi:MAG: S8 family serine peptidase [Haloglomus sp.]
MNRGTALRLAFAAVLLAAPLVPVFSVASGPPEMDHVGDSPGTSNQLERLFRDRPAFDPIDKRVLVTVELRGETSLSTAAFELRRRRYVQNGVHHVQGYVPLSAVRELSSNPAVEVVRMRQQYSAPDGRVAQGVARIGADHLHARNLTGENVTVGIIGGGFRLSDPELAGHVAAYRSFGQPGGSDHGTAVASVVADTAPGADLHVAAVGDMTSVTEYREAVTWLRASGADIIVDAGSYFDDGGADTAALSAVARNASEDVLFITSAGNYAQRHWTGTSGASERRWVTFGSGSEANPLAGGRVFAGRVRASLQWSAVGSNATTAEYELYLYRDGPRGQRVVASAGPEGNNSAAYLAATVPRGRYYLAIERANVSRPNRLELFATRDLRYRTAAGSLAVPASTPGVLAVGAYDYEADAVAAFSSRGPVGNRTGVGLVAPDAVAAPGTETTGGTSFAAPYVAGTAALLLDANPNATVADLRAALTDSANDVAAPGRDPVSGAGLLDAQDAAALLDARLQTGSIDPSTVQNATLGDGPEATGDGETPTATAGNETSTDGTNETSTDGTNETSTAGEDGSSAGDSTTGDSTTGDSTTGDSTTSDDAESDAATPTAETQE